MPSRRPPWDGFTRQEPTCERFIGGGKLETICRAPAVWTLADRGYSGGGRLDVWVYPDRAAAELAGAELTLLRAASTTTPPGRCSTPGTTRASSPATKPPTTATITDAGAGRVPATRRATPAQPRPPGTGTTLDAHVRTPKTRACPRAGAPAWGRQGTATEARDLPPTP